MTLGPNGMARDQRKEGQLFFGSRGYLLLVLQTSNGVGHSGEPSLHAKGGETSFPASDVAPGDHVTQIHRTEIRLSLHNTAC